MDYKTADRLQELRKSHGYSQETLSEMLGVSRQAVSKWERGQSSPDTDNLIALSEIYGITLDEILNPDNKLEQDKIKEENTVDDVKNAKKRKGVYTNLGTALFKFPFAIVIAGLYVLLNLKYHMWHPSWIMFMLIPIYYQLAAACKAKTQKGFLFALPVPEIVVTIYLLVGFIIGIWAKGAVLFIIIPLFYWGVAFYKKEKKDYEAEADTKEKK